MTQRGDGRFEAVGARLSDWLGAASLAAIMLLTVVDVVLRGVFNRPISGAVDLVELGLACSIFLALPAVFLRDGHLAVDVLDHVAPYAVVRFLRLLGRLVALAVLITMMACMLPVARDMHQFGDVTMTLAIPKVVYWIPVLVGIAASAAAELLAIARWRQER